MGRFPVFFYRLGKRPGFCARGCRGLGFARSCGVVISSSSMAKDPFANPAAKSRFSLGRVAFGLLLLAMITFGAGYYAPLNSAHALLAKEHRSLSETAEGTAAQLEKTTEQLISTKKERDELQESLDSVAKAQKSKKTALEAVTQAVESKLASSIKAKVITVEPTNDKVTLIIDDARLFQPTDMQPHRPGGTLLCAIAKGLKDVNATFNVGAHSQVNKVKEGKLKQTYPSTWEFTAARAGAAVRALVACGLPEKETRAIGLGHSQPNTEADKKSVGELRLVLEPKGN
jgi:chemotaxis protein MotB